MRLLRSAAVLLASAWLGCAPVRAASFPAASGTGGAVASAERLATEAGLQLLRAGGNAADAAVGVALVLAVVLPEAGNLGGGGFAITRFGDEVLALDFRETAPAAAHEATYLDAAGEPIPDASLIGPLAAGVPGSPDGLHELHRRLGRLPWRRVVAPAEQLARRGFEVSARTARSLASERELLARFDETAAVWLPAGSAPPPGALLRQPALARTLRLYAARGPAAITEGRIAAAIEESAHRHGGILTAADLAAYEPVWREPVRFTLAGHELASMPLPSSGGLILAACAGLAERTGLAALPPGGAERAHLLAEIWRRVYADRFLLGDPGSVGMPPSSLIAPERLDALAAEVRAATSATPSARVPPGEFLAGRTQAARPVPDQTTHLSVVDAEGNAVALTTTLNGAFGCGLLVPEAGFLLNNEMDDFATAPGRPNTYGLIQGEANAVGPGKRMLSSMSPTIAWRGDDVLALGSPGGSRIPTAVFQVLLATLVDGAELQAAVDRPRVHHQWLPDELVAEPDALSPETEAALLARGHALSERPTSGEVHAVRRDASGHCEAAADPRGPGVAGVIAPYDAPVPGRR